MERSWTIFKLSITDVVCSRINANEISWKSIKCISFIFFILPSTMRFSITELHVSYLIRSYGFLTYITLKCNIHCVRQYIVQQQLHVDPVVAYSTAIERSLVRILQWPTVKFSWHKKCTSEAIHHSTKVWIGTLRGLCLCKFDIPGRRMFATHKPVLK